ncbi:MAG: dihydroxy-acid dehydratase [Arenicellales bacterium WSBS_2016_MAG_OTU3]
MTTKRRSERWFSPDDLRTFGHRSRARQMGWDDDDFQRPVIAIVSTWNDLNTCHTHFPERVADVKRGVLRAGGVPVELPALSLGEQLMKPSAMMYRNLLAMQTEEMLRAYPVDAAVLMGGCDKTTPGLLMGAISVNLPCVYLPAGAMMRGHYQDETLGSGTDVWRYWDDKRTGKIGKAQWLALEEGIARTAGTCMSMGTAATMMIAAEALGLALPGGASIPAVDSHHRRLAQHTGARAVALVEENLRPSDILSRDSFANATAAVVLCGGSTNAIIHLAALARRAGIEWSPAQFAAVADQTPLLLNLKPSGEYVMEDFHRAGGVLALFLRAKRFFCPRAKTVSGKTFAACLPKAAVVYNDEVIRPLSRPLQKNGGLKVLTGSLAPDGCIIKVSAAAKHLHKHRGRAVVFQNMADLKRRIDSPALDVCADSVLVLKNAGPVGAPGMPEWGQLPIPKRLLAAGVKDMLRLSDARMSGTSYGACVLHIAPEAAVGGPLGLVQNGDEIAIDIKRGRLDLLVPAKELAKRRKAFAPTHTGRAYQSGYGWLYTHHVLQANEGCDFDFASRIPGDTREPDIF